MSLKNPFFLGFVAKKNGTAIGYIFYHYGYDPDEMEGRVIYIIDLFVTGKERSHGVGRLLMKNVAKECKRIGGISIYFGVWLKNKEAASFYRKLRAEFADELPFMHWDRNKWESGR